MIPGHQDIHPKQVMNILCFHIISINLLLDFLYFCRINTSINCWVESLCMLVDPDLYYLNHLMPKNKWFIPFEHNTTEGGMTIHNLIREQKIIEYHSTSHFKKLTGFINSLHTRCQSHLILPHLN